MTARGRLALALGVATYAAAWAFGSRPLYPAAVGLLLAVLLAWLAVRVTARPVQLRRTLKTEPLEGDDVQVRVELELESGVAPAGITLVERYTALGERRTPLERAGRHLWARYVLPEVRRGRYRIGATAVVEDPFGLERVELPLGNQPALVVYPRLVDVDRLFSEAGSHLRDGRRLLLQRPSGFDVHSVREYVVGDSLRKVHWRSTARRARLMVKELEDSPRDELAVVLDAHAPSVSDGSFDAAVRAAGSVLHAYVRRGRRAALVIGGATTVVQRVHAEGDWRRALELLAAADADGDAPAERLFGGERNPAALAVDLVVVTSRLTDGFAERLVHRAGAQRNTAVVYVDAPSWNGRERPEPTLLRLQAAGVAVAVLRRGDDLARVLAAAQVPEAAHA